MSKLNQTLTIIYLLSINAICQAVQVSEKGIGEVLIYPYYTVNNDLNTLYSVINTTAETKAIKVKFLESGIGHEVLDFNVYLGAYDVWTGGLIPTTSTIPSSAGEPSVAHVSTDTSCAPFLNKAWQEFLPFVIDTDLDSGNQSMQRATEGHIVIMEMAVLTGDSVQWADHGNVGVPSNCANIEGEWSDNNIWDEADESAPTGGLIGSGFIVNVAQGMSFPFDAIALQNFWQGEGEHTSPGTLTPTLNSAFPESDVLLSDGELITSTWEHGYQAVSAVLTHSRVLNEYALDSVLSARSEWVMNFPTKKFHTNSGTEDTLLPFAETWDGSHSCERFSIDMWDREEQFETTNTCCVDPPPPGGVFPRMCQNSQVIEFLIWTPNGFNRSTILGSHNYTLYTTPGNAVTESGWAKLQYLDTQADTPLTGQGFEGLPVIGFAVMQFTNSGAAAGLLAQYGSAFMHKNMVEVVNSDSP